MVTGPQTRFGIAPGVPRPGPFLHPAAALGSSPCRPGAGIRLGPSRCRPPVGRRRDLRRMSDQRPRQFGRWLVLLRRAARQTCELARRNARSARGAPLSEPHRAEIESDPEPGPQIPRRPTPAVADGTEPPREASLDQGDQVGVEGTCRQSDAQDQAASGGQEVCAGHVVALPVVETDEIQRGDHGNGQVTAIRTCPQGGSPASSRDPTGSWPPSTWRRVWGAHPGPEAGSGPDRRYGLARRLAPPPPDWSASRRGRVRPSRPRSPPSCSMARSLARSWRSMAEVN